MGVGGWQDVAVVPEGSVDPIPYNATQDLRACSHALDSKGATAD